MSTAPTAPGQPYKLAQPFAPRWTVRSVVLAGTVTLAIFLLLPWMETFSELPEPDRTLRQVDTQTLPPPPPPPPPETIQEQASRDLDLPRPQMTVTQQTIAPPRPQLDLNIELGEVGGDFAVNFQVGGTDLAAQIDNLIFEVGELDQAPAPLARLNPLYPPRARMRRIEGVVVVEFLVTETGEVRDPTVRSSQPGDIFTSAALRAVQRWRFNPGIRDGEAVVTRVRQRISFTLQ